MRWLARIGAVHLGEMRVWLFLVIATAACEPQKSRSEPGDDIRFAAVGPIPARGDEPGGCITGDPGSSPDGGDPVAFGDGGDALDGGDSGDAPGGDGGGDRPGDAPGDAGGDARAGDPVDCPDDMVPIGSVCIDRYEASRVDATATDVGSNESIAVSQPGVLPWYVTLMSATVLDTYAAACAAAGKRLCNPSEWLEACDGPDDSTYVFGDTWDRETCNNVETLCDDYCVEQSIDLADCFMGANCGGSCGLTSAQPTGVHCYDILPTGSFPGCTNAYGTYDVNGNVWEVVPSSNDKRGFQVRGGACNCYAPSWRLECSFNASWNGLYAGFRCCLPR